MTSVDNDDWDWDNGDDEVSFRTPCLFCKQYLDLQDLLVHMEKDHNVSFENLAALSKNQQYNYIKLINFIRTHKLSPEQVSVFDQSFFDTIESNKYLKPSINDDGLLMIERDWDDDDIEMAVNPVADDLDEETKAELVQIKEDEDKEMIEEPVESSEEDD